MKCKPKPRTLWGAPIIAENSSLVPITIRFSKLTILYQIFSAILFADSPWTRHDEKTNKEKAAAGSMVIFLLCEPPAVNDSSAVLLLQTVSHCLHTALYFDLLMALQGMRPINPLDNCLDYDVIAQCFQQIMYFYSKLVHDRRKLLYNWRSASLDPICSVRRGTVRRLSDKSFVKLIIEQSTVKPS